MSPDVSRRDWILLPAVSLLTICVLAISVELLSRWLYPMTQVGFQNCFAGDAAVRPNSVCWEQIPESTSKVEYRFNSRGHRAGMELNPKSSGTYRIVLIGSSLTQGLYIPREKTFAALLPARLSLETGRKVEVYNEARGGKFRGGSFPTQNPAKHFDEILAAQPDLILWVITPTDVMNAESTENVEPAPKSAIAQDRPRSFWTKLTASVTNGTLLEHGKTFWDKSRTSLVLKHLLIASESRDEYIESYLRNGDDASFLRTQPDARWHKRQQSFDAELAEIVESAKRVGVPLVAVLVPNRVQAAMVAKGDWPAGYDPFQLQDEVRTAIVNHGGQFIDILSDYRAVSGPERDYFPMDGHPDANGQALVLKFLSKELTRGSVPDLKASTPSDVAMEPGK